MLISKWIFFNQIKVGLVGNWIKLKTQSFLLNGTDVWSIYFDFLSGSFYYTLSKNNSPIRQNIINLSLTYTYLAHTVINNLFFNYWNLSSFLFRDNTCKIKIKYQYDASSPYWTKLRKVVSKIVDYCVSQVSIC